MKRRQPTPDESTEREIDPSELTRYFIRHPWMAGVGSGAVLFALGLARGVPWPIASGVGVTVALFTGLVWRPGGPGQCWRRYLLQRFPRKDDGDS